MQKVRKQFFFEKKNQKTLVPFARAAGARRSHWQTVFASFFQKGSLFLAVLFVPVAAQAERPLLGEWMTEDHAGVVRIEPCGDAYCGRVVGISDFPPGGLRDLHGAPQCGLIIVRGLRPGDDGRRHGTITNPDDGKTYDAIMWVAPDGDLRLRGYIGLPLFGSTQHWPHFAGTLTKDCHFTQR